MAIEWETWWLPSGKRLLDHGESPFLMGKLTISMAMFNSYVSLPGDYHGLSQSMNWESREKPRKTRQCEGMKESFEHCSYGNMLFSSGLWPCFKQSSLMDRLHGDLYWFHTRMLRFAIFICFNIHGDPLLQVKSAIEFWFQFPTFVSKSNPPPTHLDNESVIGALHDEYIKYLIMIGWVWK